MLPDDTQLVENLPMATRYRLIHHVSVTFWEKWCVLVGPGLVLRQKWHQKSRNLKVGDLVMIADPSKFNAKYKLAIVAAVNFSAPHVVVPRHCRSHSLRGTHCHGGVNATAPSAVLSS